MTDSPIHQKPSGFNQERLSMAGYRDPTASFNTINLGLHGLFLDEAAGHCGLENEGSTCYLNAVLQTLFKTKEFRKHVMRLGGVSSDNFIIELKKLFNKLKERKERVVSSAGIRKSLGITDVHKQADAAEHLQSIINKTPGSSEFFKGTMKTTRTCRKCRDEHESFEEFLSLIVSLEDSQDVEDAVKAHVDQLCGVYQMTCSCCKSKTDWKRKTEIINFPKILIIQLRRFEMMSSGLIYRKNHRKMSIRPLIEVSSVEYDLYAIINHSGTYEAGHYYADIQCGQIWYRFNDESVKKLKESPTFSSDAYLLVYRRRE